MERSRHEPAANGRAERAKEPGRQPLATTCTGAGRRVVLVHGFTQTGQSWRRVAAALEERFEVVCVDLPGHGGSASHRVSGLSEAAALLGETAGGAAYVGYSLGGRLCLTLALEQPEFVEQLVLVGATAGIEDPGERAARRSSDAALADRLDPSEPGRTPVGVAPFLGEWLAGPLFAHLDPVQADVASRLVNTGAGLASSLRTVGTGNQEPSWDRLASLEMPVLLVTGERDEKFARLADHMASAIGPNATHEVIAGAGHAVPFEAPAAFASLLLGAIAGG